MVRCRACDQGAKITHHPDVLRNKQNLSLRWEESHPFSCSPLFFRLRRNPGPVPTHLEHTMKRLFVMFQRLIERLCKRLIRDIWALGQHTIQFHCTMLCLKVPSCVGPMPPLVITKSYRWTMRLLASTLRTSMEHQVNHGGQQSLSQVLTYRLPHQGSPQRVVCSAQR